jgi:ribosomal protein S6
MTAVEWLAEQIEQYILTFGNLPINVLNKLKKQAKEMEKQQIVDACYFGSQNLPYEIKDKSEQYYNETFNK